MSCEYSENVSSLIDGELSPAEARATELHLSECRECQLLRNDSLGFRKQINSYCLSQEPTAPRGALARILARPTTVGFAGLRLHPPLAAVAALFLVAISIGTVLFVRHRSPGVNQTSQLTIRTGGRAPSISPDETIASGVEQRRKNPKGQPSGPANGPRKPNSPAKQNRERSAPKPPEPRTLAPPTYALAQPIAPNDSESLRPADSETQTLSHLQQSELLLRNFRNVRLAGKRGRSDVNYQRKRAGQLVYQNILLRREAETAGDVQVATLLESLEPILLDIANLRAVPKNEEVSEIKRRMERKSLVALLQVNSAAVARSNE